MARVKTNVVNVKVDDKGTKITVKVECADVASVNVEALQKMYESQWKQFMYSTVQATIKEMYASVAANKQVVESMRTIFHATDEQISAFMAFQEQSNGAPFVTELPNLFTLRPDLTVEYSTVTETEEEESEEIPDVSEDESGVIEN